MSKDHSTKSNVRSKPDRPAGSPLFWHASGRWAKKIKGRFHYFGRGTHDEALAEYNRAKDDLHAGRLPREEPDGLTVYGLCAKFLTVKLQRRDAGELAPRTFDDYSRMCQLIIRTMGKNRIVSDLRPGDFAKLRTVLGKKWGIVRVAKCINEARVVFNFAYKNGLIERPMIYGEGFRRPSKKALRQHRQAQGPRMFEAEEIRQLLGLPPWAPFAGTALRAMILLGANCGFGNSDVGKLPLSALDLDGGFVTYPRAKTAIERRCPLWPETVQALRNWLAVRPEPIRNELRGLVFLTVRGDSWAKLSMDNPISKETAKLMKLCGLNGHRNFYALRHGFQTIGDESGDFLAVRKIMGHASNDIADVYRERVSDARLQKVTDHVRGWLFGAMDGGKGAEPATEARPQLRVVG